MKSIELCRLARLPEENIDQYLQNMRESMKFSFSAEDCEPNTSMIERANLKSPQELSYDQIFQNGENLWPDKPFFASEKVI